MRHAAYCSLRRPGASYEAPIRGGPQTYEVTPSIFGDVRPSVYETPLLGRGGIYHGEMFPVWMAYRGDAAGISAGEPGAIYPIAPRTVQQVRRPWRMGIHTGLEEY